MQHKIVTKENNEVLMEGKFTFNDCLEFRNIFNTLSKSNKNTIFDFSKVSYIDTAALGMLLIADEHLSSHKNKMFIRNPQKEVHKLLTIASMDKIIPII